MRLIELDYGTPAPKTNGAAPVRLEIDGVPVEAEFKVD